MSSVEDLVQLAKEGGDTSGLWEQVNRLIYRWCFRYYDIAAKQYLEMVDLLNSAYFGMLQAVQAFDPLRGFKFVTLLQYYVRRSVRVLLGLRTGKKKVPLISLDEPLNEEDFTLLDTVEDMGAVEPFERAENSVAHSFIWQEVDKLPAEQSSVIYGVFSERKTYVAIGQERGCSVENIRQIQNKAMRKLRNSEGVRRYAAEEYAYNQIGVESFQRTGTSSTEWAVLKAEFDRERAEFDAMRTEREKLTKANF